MIIVLFALVAIFLVCGIPIFIALAGSTSVAFALFSNIDLTIVPQRMIAGVDKFSLMSVPLFILAANLMGRGGISSRIIKLANVLVGRLRGGMGITAILACLFFGAISGSAPATVVAIGGIMYPELMRQKYPKDYSTGVLVSSGALGLIIPPSMTMIVYGTVTGASIGALFMAGFGAGIVFALVYIIYTIIYAGKHPEIEKSPKRSSKENWKIVRESIWGIGMPVIILGGIYGGIFTPTEAAAVSVIYALIISMFVYRELDFKGVLKCALDSGVTSVQIMILLAAASIFSWILTSEGVTQVWANAMLSVSSNKYVILIMINILLLICGMFLDGSSIITILAPLLYPIATGVGVDPVHLGIIMVVNTAIGMFTPPFGLNLFVGSTITKQPVMKVAKGAVPFIILSLIAMLVTTYCPDLVLFIPRMMYGTW